MSPDPRLGKAQKRGGYPPSPLFLGWVERARDLGLGGYIESRGRPGSFSLQMVGEWSLHLNIRLIGPLLFMFGSCFRHRQG